jgi:bacterioferritin-associated ferredoxin
LSNSNEIVCYCAGVNRATIVDAIKHGATTLKAIQQVVGAGIGSRCKELNPKGVCCHADIVAILETELGSRGGTSESCSCCST